MVDIVKSQFKIKKSLNKIVEDLLNMFLAKDTSDGTGCDNMTAIVISLKPYPWSQIKIINNILING